MHAAKSVHWSLLSQTPSVSIRHKNRSSQGVRNGHCTVSVPVEDVLVDVATAGEFAQAVVSRGHGVVVVGQFISATKNLICVTNAVVVVVFETVSTTSANGVKNVTIAIANPICLACAGVVGDKNCTNSFDVPDLVARHSGRPQLGLRRRWTRAECTSQTPATCPNPPYTTDPMHVDHPKFPATPSVFVGKPWALVPTWNGWLTSTLEF